jgi:hypothetical protein
MKSTYLRYLLIVFLLDIFLSINVNAQTQIGGSITTNTTLGPSGSEPDNVYWVTSDLIIESYVTLTIEPGVVLKFDGSRSLQLRDYSSLVALGAVSQPIIFTSILDDGFGGDTNGDGSATIPSPGDWGMAIGTYDIRTGIQIGASGVTVRMDYCIVRYSKTGLCVLGSSDPQNPNLQLEMTNCEFSYNYGFPVEVPVYSIPVVRDPSNIYHDNLWEAIGITTCVLSSDLTLSKGKTYVLPTLVGITVLDATLTLEPGVVFKGMDRSAINIRSNLPDGSAPGSKLIAIGTLSEPIIFTSFLDDTYGGDTNGDENASSPPATPREWHGIVVYAEPTEVDFDYCIFKYMVTGIYVRGNDYGWGTDPVASIRNSNVAYCSDFPIVVPMNTIQQALDPSNSYIDNHFNAIGISASTLTQNAVWSNRLPLVDISPGVVLVAAELIMDPGVIFKSKSSGLRLVENGNLNALGTAAEPIVFTDSKDIEGGVTDNSPDLPTSGDWRGIEVFAKPIPTVANFDHCVFRYAINGVYTSGNDYGYYTDPVVSLSNSEVANSSDFPVVVPMNTVQQALEPSNSYVNNQFDAIGISASTLTQNATWSNRMPLVSITGVYSGVGVVAELTLEPGAIFKSAYANLWGQQQSRLFLPAPRTPRVE